MRAVGTVSPEADERMAKRKKFRLKHQDILSKYQDYLIKFTKDDWNMFHHHKDFVKLKEELENDFAQDTYFKHIMNDTKSLADVLSKEDFGKDLLLHNDFEKSINRNQKLKSIL